MWDWEYAWSILPDLVHAMATGLLATLWGFAVSCIGGLLLATASRSRFTGVRYLISGIMQFIRNTPLLVQLFFLYYSLPPLTGLSPSAFLTGVVGLGLHFSTFMSEVYRAGIDSVPQGQWEAARALNLKGGQKWLSVILPQAIPPMIPVMGNYLIAIFKETPILSSITLMETMLAAKNITSISYRFFEPYTIVGILFLVICLTVSLPMRWLERRYTRYLFKERADTQRKEGRSNERVQDEIAGREIYPG